MSQSESKPNTQQVSHNVATTSTHTLSDTGPDPQEIAARIGMRGAGTEISAINRLTDALLSRLNAGGR